MPDHHHCKNTSYWIARWLGMSVNEKEQARKFAEKCPRCKRFLENAIASVEVNEANQACKTCFEDAGIPWGVNELADRQDGVCPIARRDEIRVCSKTGENLSPLGKIRRH